MTTSEGWNPRYVEYARAHGKNPEEMLEHDAEHHPGGKMAGFIVWNSGQVQKFASQWPGCHTLAEVTLAEPGKDIHALYNDWLHTTVTAQLEEMKTT